MNPSVAVSCDPPPGEARSDPTATAHAAPTREASHPVGRTILDIASPPYAADSPAGPKGSANSDAALRAPAPTPDQTRPWPAGPGGPGDQHSAGRPRSRLRGFLVSASKTILTLLLVLVAALAALIVWDYYVVAPWTRDGRVRAQVASVAPQVSGQITELRVADNQYVKKGDTLYFIDPFDFQRALASPRPTCG